jgi:hypothetical protein
MLAFDKRGPYRVDYDVGNYGVEGAMDTYMARKIEEHFPRIGKLHRFLIKNKHTEDNPWEFGIDAYAFYIPDKERGIFVVERRSRHYLLILDKHPLYKDNKIVDSKTLHIRRIWDSISEHCDEDGFDQELKEKGLSHAVKHANDLTDYSDNINDYPYVRRPDLAWYKKRKFELEYSDCRDAGYVLTLGGLMYRDRLDQCLGNYYDIKDAFFWINLAHNNMEEAS